MNLRRLCAAKVALALGGGLLSTAWLPLAPALAATATYDQAQAVYLQDQLTYSTNPTDITFTADAPTVGSSYPSQIVVPPTNGTVVDLDVELTMTHTFPDDLDLMLVGPAGQQVMLLSDAGGSDDLNDTFLTIDDSAGAAPDSTNLVQPFVYSYRPTDHDPGDSFPAPAPSAAPGTSLAVFNGSNPAGTWSLYAVDDATGDAGAVTAWSLELQTSVTHPAVALPSPSSITVAAAPIGITDVDVVLRSLDHLYLQDVDLLLVGPTGKQVMLASDAGGTGDAVDATITFDDEAANALPEGSSNLVTGSYRPANYGAGTDPVPGLDTSAAATALSAFDGTDPNGTWNLYAVDDAAGVRGDISGGWSLRIGTVDLPAAPAITAPSSGGYDRDGTLTVTGAAPAGAVVKVHDGTSQVASTVSAASGAWSTTVTGLTNGAHTLTATATDGYGNVSAASNAVTVTIDRLAPRVSRSTPPHRAVGVRRGANLVVLFSEPVQRSTLTATNVRLVRLGTTTAVRARLSYDVQQRRLVVNPRRDLAGDTTYVLTVRTGVKDLAGNPLDQSTKRGLQAKVVRFTTR